MITLPVSTLIPGTKFICPIHGEKIKTTHGCSHCTKNVEVLSFEKTTLSTIPDGTFFSVATGKVYCKINETTYINDELKTVPFAINTMVTIVHEPFDTNNFPQNTQFYFSDSIKYDPYTYELKDDRIHCFDINTYHSAAVYRRYNIIPVDWSILYSTPSTISSTNPVVIPQQGIYFMDLKIGTYYKLYKDSKKVYLKVSDTQFSTPTTVFENTLQKPIISLTANEVQKMKLTWEECPIGLIYAEFEMKISSDKTYKIASKAITKYYSNKFPNNTITNPTVEQLSHIEKEEVITFGDLKIGDCFVFKAQVDKRDILVKIPNGYAAIPNMGNSLGSTTSKYFNFTTSPVIKIML